MKEFDKKILKEMLVNDIVNVSLDYCKKVQELATEIATNRGITKEEIDKKSDNIFSNLYDDCYAIADSLFYKLEKENEN